MTEKEIDNVKNRIKDNHILIPNYFGEQRFSNDNASIGKAMIKKNFKEAVDLIIKNNSEQNEKIKEHLKKHPNDSVVALKIIPFKLLKFYIHSYQSFLFNRTLEEYINLLKNNKRPPINEKIPIIGFATEIKNNEIKNITDKIITEGKITFRDFIIRQIPDLSFEGDERNAFLKINDFEILKREKDELNENREKITVKFSLPKGAYATVFVDYLFN